MATPAHRRSISEGGFAAEGWRSFPVKTASAAVAVLLAGLLAAGVFVLAHRGASPQPAAAGSSRGGGQRADGAAGPTGTTGPAPLSVTAVRPAGSSAAAAAGPVTVAFSAPLSAGDPRPTLDPAVAGTWTRSGAELTFHPTGGFIPFTKETVTVPSGVNATEQGRTVSLAHAYTASFTVAGGSIRRLQQLLAELGYLPVRFTPTGGVTTASAVTSSRAALDREPTRADEVDTSPVSGSFSWASPNVPLSLKEKWTTGSANVVTKGAVMAFEADHGLAVDGIAGPEVWAALVNAVAARESDPRPYSYIEVSESSPETLSVWQNGKVVLRTLTNTGVPGARTALGTYPIYTHEALTRMRGTDVNGSKYNVLVRYVGYFYEGDAVHSYPRASYGFPQSNGCVEVPLSAGRELFDSDINYYGTLVTVTPPGR